VGSSAGSLDRALVLPAQPARRQQRCQHNQQRPPQQLLLRRRRRLWLPVASSSSEAALAQHLLQRALLLVDARLHTVSVRAQGVSQESGMLSVLTAALAVRLLLLLGRHE
jgi:hypothetical protein